MAWYLVFTCVFALLRVGSADAKRPALAAAAAPAPTAVPVAPKPSFFASSLTPPSDASSATAAASAGASSLGAHAILVAPVAPDAEDDTAYSEYLPYLFRSSLAAIVTVRELESFNEAVDEFYTRVEASKETAKLAAQEAAAWHKVERIRQDHAGRVQQLLEVQQSAERKARLVQHQHYGVEQAMLAIRQTLATGTPPTARAHTTSRRCISP